MSGRRYEDFRYVPELDPDLGRDCFGYLRERAANTKCFIDLLERELLTTKQVNERAFTQGMTPCATWLRAHSTITKEQAIKIIGKESKKDEKRLDFAQNATIDGHASDSWYIQGETYFRMTLRQAIDKAMADQKIRDAMKKEPGDAALD